MLNSKHLCVWLVVAALAACAWAQPIDNAASAGRSSRDKLSGVLANHLFDFEERDIHYEDQPMNWTKWAGPGEFYPHYATGRLSTEHQRSGEYSFELQAHGGSVGFEYGRRFIRAPPGSDFHISGYVHFENVRRVRARLSCVLTDRTGREIPGSRCLSELVGPDQEDRDGWAHLEVYVPGSFPNARFIAIAVWVLQESQWSQEADADASIFQPDVRAIAWFDDISIYQLPRVVLSTDQPGNVFGADDTPRLQVEVEGVSHLDYQIRLRVSDVTGNVMQDEKWILVGVEDTVRVKTMELPQLGPGLYHARMDIVSGGASVAARELSFLKTAPLSGDLTTRGSGFGLLLLDDKVGSLDTGIELVRAANARLIKLPVWRAHEDQPGSIFSEPDFDRQLLKLPQYDIQVVATFSEVPDSLWLKMRSKRRTVLDMLSQEAELWVPQVASVLARYARQIPYWQIGPDTRSENQYWEPRIGNVVEAMRKEFQELVGYTVLAVPLSSMFDVDHEQVRTDYVALNVSAAIEPQQVAAYLEDWRSRGLKHIWVTIETLDSDVYLREEVLADFAKRVAFAKKGGAEAIYINHPWVCAISNARVTYKPTEFLLVFRTLADHLGGLRYVGQFDLTDDVPALIFDLDGTGCIFTWRRGRERDGGESRELDVYLGENVQMIDLFGNVTPLPSKAGVSRVRVGSLPIMLSGIDTRLARLQASLKLTPSALDGSVSRQRVKLSFVNPFGTSISGRVRFRVGPDYRNNWAMEPGYFNFMLRTDETLEKEVIITLPRNEIGGEKRLELSLIIDAGRSYRLRAAIPLEIRLKGVEVSVFARRLGARNLLVQLVVTNTSQKEVSLNSFVDLPDGDRIERVISRLQPGASASKSFPIPDAVEWLGEFLRVGLYDPRGVKRINYHVQIN